MNMTFIAETDHGKTPSGDTMTITPMNNSEKAIVGEATMEFTLNCPEGEESESEHVKIFRKHFGDKLVTRSKHDAIATARAYHDFNWRLLAKMLLNDCNLRAYTNVAADLTCEWGSKIYTDTVAGKVDSAYLNEARDTYNKELGANFAYLFWNQCLTHGLVEPKSN